MEFQWDDTKAVANAEKHGVTFEYATRVFLDPCRLETVDDRRDYGESRHPVLGLIEGRAFVVVCTIRSGRIRIISARRASRREQRAYELQAAP